MNVKHVLYVNAYSTVQPIAYIIGKFPYLQKYRRILSIILVEIVVKVFVKIVHLINDLFPKEIG